MRKIEQQMVDAIRQRVSLSGGNTTVTIDLDVNTGAPAVATVFLHGKWIAEMEYDAQVTGFDDGNQHDVLMLVRRDDWVTATTQSRYNALLEAFAPRFKTRRFGENWNLQENSTAEVSPMPEYAMFVEGIWI